jgi:hypothetical protein
MPDEKVNHTANPKPSLCPNMFRDNPMDCSLACGMWEAQEEDCHVPEVSRSLPHLGESE